MDIEEDPVYKKFKELMKKTRDPLFDQNSFHIYCETIRYAVDFLDGSISEEDYKKFSEMDHEELKKYMLDSKRTMLNAPAGI